MPMIWVTIVPPSTAGFEQTGCFDFDDKRTGSLVVGQHTGNVAHGGGVLQLATHFHVRIRTVSSAQIRTVLETLFQHVDGLGGHKEGPR